MHFITKYDISDHVTTLIVCNKFPLCKDQEMLSWNCTC